MLVLSGLSNDKSPAWTGRREMEQKEYDRVGEKQNALGLLKRDHVRLTRSEKSSCKKGLRKSLIGGRDWGILGSIC